MNVVPTYPPNYEKIAKRFDIKGRHGIIFTYGTTIYNPSRIEISPDLFAHERVHSVRQGKIEGGPEAWWNAYCDRAEFRLQEELLAYKEQWRFAQENYPRAQRRGLLDHISKALAGPMYGNMMSVKEAKRMISE